MMSSAINSVPSWSAASDHHNSAAAGGHTIGRVGCEMRAPMNDISPARRARRAFMQLSAAVSVAVFLLLGSTVLLDQWIIGQASVRFMIGTAMLVVGFCTGLFA